MSFTARNLVVYIVSKIATAEYFLITKVEKGIKIGSIMNGTWSILIVNSELEYIIMIKIMEHNFHNKLSLIETVVRGNCKLTLLVQLNI